MCGLCGVLSTSLSGKEIEAFQGLMTVSTLRGSYGSGLVAVPVLNKPIEVLRHESYTSAELAHSGEFCKVIADNSLSLLMGHARHPTKGGLAIEDTHPHQCEHILGMHNGTLTHLQDQRLGEPKKGEVGISDSRLLFENVARYGIEETIKKSKGSYALTYIDKKADTLHFLRNGDRPFFWAMVGSMNTLYWASESAMLRLVLERIYPASQVNVYRSQPDVLTTFRCRPISKIGYFDKKELKQGGMVIGQNVVPFKGQAEAVTEMAETKPGFYVHKEEIPELLTGGCTYCNRAGNMIDYKQKRMFWIDQTHYVCYDCAKYDQFAADYLTSEGHILPAWN